MLFRSGCSRLEQNGACAVLADDLVGDGGALQGNLALAVGRDTKGGQTVLNGQEGVSEESLTPEQKREIYQALAKAQLKAWDAGSGYFYWSYKLLTDTVNTPGWVGWDSWDLGRCVDFGWFPTER